MKPTALFLDVIKTAAASAPDSVVADLLMLFPAEIVAKILMTFSGEVVRFPSVEKLWMAHREALVKEILDLDNSKTARQTLASHFGTTTDHISRIYCRVRARRKSPSIHRGAGARSARRAYRNKFDGLMADLREALYSK